VARRMTEFLREKRERQPLSEWSAGCVFKNPEGAEAGRLIDEAGCKHLKRGDVEVSGLHANFFINKGSGRASDFLALMDIVKERVLKLFGQELEAEIKVVGRGETERWG
jgi:UDP-N-acetylmuramate dehydrogenase